MSEQQRHALDQLLREGPLDLGGEVAEQRAIFEQMMGAIPVPEDVSTATATLGGVPVIHVRIAGAAADTVIFYLHGGAYAIGTAASSVGLASELARRTGAAAVSVDYRLAPEHPHPAAVDDAVAAYTGLLDSGVSASRIAIAGESAGGGLAIAALVALRDRAVALPAAGALMSPWADLTLSGTSLHTKADLDPALTPAGLARRADDYAPHGDRHHGLISPVFADLRGLPPLLIQAGSHEILLDDAIRLAGRAAADDVDVTLEVTPGVPHVFQGFAAMLDEGADALSRAGRFLARRLQTG